MKKENLIKLIKIDADFKYIKSIINSLSLNSLDRKGNSALHLAIMKKNIGLVKLLITAGIEINRANKQKVSPFELAIHFKDVRVVNILLLNKVLFFNRDGYTPLHAACTSGSLAIFNKLINYYPNVNIIDNGGYTPLHWACQEGHGTIVSKLIGKGAIVNVLDFNGFTPLKIAVGEGRLTIFRQLINKNALIGDFSNDTLLHSAVAWNHLAIVKEIVKNECNINALDDNGNTPLHYAHMYRHKEIEKFLLDEGSDSRIKNRFGFLPLEITLEEYEKFDI